jgi:hypothetical protein
MYLLRKRKVRFLQISSASADYYSNLSETNQLKKFIVATGFLNHIWQSWNQFWRAYWVAHIIGGKDLQNNRIMALNPSFDEPHALYHLLTLIRKRTRGSIGTVNYSYQEVTWGDLKTIEELAFAIQLPNNNVHRALNAASLFGVTIEHIQIIRNAQIHISNSNMNKLRSVTPNYVISSNPKYPHEILEAREMISGKVAMKAWIENMNDFLNYL